MQNPQQKNNQYALDLLAAPAINIFAKHGFDESWCDKVLVCSKWSDKKGYLDTFLKAADVPQKIKGDSQQLSAVTSMAKRLVNDSNVQVQIGA